MCQITRQESLQKICFLDPNSVMEFPSLPTPSQKIFSFQKSEMPKAGKFVNQIYEIWRRKYPLLMPSVEPRSFSYQSRSHSSDYANFLIILFSITVNMIKTFNQNFAKYQKFKILRLHCNVSKFDKINNGEKVLTNLI